ncbi:MAG: nicotinate phosphoribosyltransferase [Gammaproteobacteria bacterium]|nr:nicotinate phosphoribosyltransferase [Gammaproteobacteria bacterium]
MTNEPVADSSPLLTDLYQLTMLQAYFEHGMTDAAVFEFFVRTLPAQRQFLVAAGLEQVVGFLENLRFGATELEWMARQGSFRPEFINYLGGLRFSGDVHAMPEGTIFFADEPILRITAPLPEAQLIESRVINLLHFQTMIASKAIRCVLAAPAALLVDFGLRRAHGAEAGLLAARASYLAGFAGTATVLAAPRFGIPLFGTMAHSFIEAHEHEIDAFERFAYSLPGNVVLLIDTYDTEAGAAKVVQLAPRLKAAGIEIRGVRLDSGDLGAHARKVRRILDDGGLQQVTIFASGNLDEMRLQRLLADGAPIDGFGVGTHMDTSSDAPFLDCAYKLQEYAGRPRRKCSEGKATWPGTKQVHRRFDCQGIMCGDGLDLEGEDGDGVALLQPVMRYGRRLAAPAELAAIRAHVSAEIARLPLELRTITGTGQYRVSVSPTLRELARRLDARGT